MRAPTWAGSRRKWRSRNGRRIRTQFDFPPPFFVYYMHGHRCLKTLGPSLLARNAGKGAHRFIRLRKKHTVAACWLSRRLFKPRSPARWGLNCYQFSTDGEMNL